MRTVRPAAAISEPFGARSAGSRTPWFDTGLGQLAGSLAPLTLLASVYQLQFASFESNGRALAAGLAIKLVMVPALIACVGVLSLQLPADQLQVVVLRMATPPMVMGSLLAIRFGLNPSLAALMVGVGTPVSLLTMPVWSAVLNVLPHGATLVAAGL